MKTDLWFSEGVCETIRQLSLPVFGIFLATWLGFRVGRTSKRQNDLRDDQLQLVPLLHGFIKEAESSFAPISVWHDSKNELEKRILKFKMHLTGRRKAALCKSWERFEQIKNAELYANTPSGDFGDCGSLEDLQRAQQILKKRLSELLVSVENA